MKDSPQPILRISDLLVKPKPFDNPDFDLYLQLLAEEKIIQHRNVDELKKEIIPIFLEFIKAKSEPEVVRMFKERELMPHFDECERFFKLMDIPEISWEDLNANITSSDHSTRNRVAYFIYAMSKPFIFQAFSSRVSAVRQMWMGNSEAFKKEKAKQKIKSMADKNYEEEFGNAVVSMLGDLKGPEVFEIPLDHTSNFERFKSIAQTLRKLRIIDISRSLNKSLGGSVFWGNGFDADPGGNIEDLGMTWRLIPFYIDYDVTDALIANYEELTRTKYKGEIFKMYGRTEWVEKSQLTAMQLLEQAKLKEQIFSDLGFKEGSLRTRTYDDQVSSWLTHNFASAREIFMPRGHFHYFPNPEDFKLEKSFRKKNWENFEREMTEVNGSFYIFARYVARLESTGLGGPRLDSSLVTEPALALEPKQDFDISFKGMITSFLYSGHDFTYRMIPILLRAREDELYLNQTDIDYLGEFFGERMVKLALTGTKRDKIEEILQGLGKYREMIEKSLPEKFSKRLEEAEKLFPRIKKMLVDQHILCDLHDRVSEGLTLEKLFSTTYQYASEKAVSLEEAWNFVSENLVGETADYGWMPWQFEKYNQSDFRKCFYTDSKPVWKTLDAAMQFAGGIVYKFQEEFEEQFKVERVEKNSELKGMFDHWLHIPETAVRQIQRYEIVYPAGVGSENKTIRTWYQYKNVRKKVSEKIQGYIIE